MPLLWERSARDKVCDINYPGQQLGRGSLPVWSALAEDRLYKRDQPEAEWSCWFRLLWAGVEPASLVPWKQCRFQQNIEKRWAGASFFLKKNYIFFSGNDMVVLVRFFNIGKYFNIYRLILKQSHITWSLKLRYNSYSTKFALFRVQFSDFFLVDSQSHTIITTT